MKGLSLFSGIGGLDIAAEWTGIESVAFCEIDKYACKVLKKRWPDVPIINDVRDVTKGAEAIGEEAIDVVHGGFPCQDLSQAGKQAGLEGDRSGLWFEMLRVVEEIRPCFVVAENVRGAINLALDTVQTGLEDAGYEVRTVLIPASAFGAPHRRERIFVLGVRRDVADALRIRTEAGFPAEAEWEEGHADIANNRGGVDDRVGDYIEGNERANGRGTVGTL